MRVILFVVGLLATTAAVRGFLRIGPVYQAVAANPNDAELQGQLFGHVVFGIVLLAVAYKCFFRPRPQVAKSDGRR